MEPPSTRRVAPTPPTEARPRAAQREETSLDRYVLLERVGVGGMGEVHRAYDPSLGRVVAIKRVIPQADPDGVEARRLRREAQAIAQLSHPNVIAVYDVGPAGEPGAESPVFVVMELVDGLPLHRWLEQRKPSRAEVLDVFLQAARGLAAAHDAGLVHRDFKPGNVIVGDDGRVRVLDFGLARRPSAPPPAEIAAESSGSGGFASPRTEIDDAGRASLLDGAVTRPGAAAGTPRYMAPEQFLQRPIDGRSDQFAFGVALYEALTRRRPFAGEALIEIGRAVVRGELRPIPPELALPDWLARLLTRCLARDPDARFASMHGVIAELTQSRTQARAEGTRGSRVEDVLAAFPPPEDPALAERVATIRAELAEVEALRARGDFAEALALGRRVALQAADLEYLPLTASCLYALGRLQHRTGDPATAYATLHRAAELAARGGDDWQIANVWVALVSVLGEGLRRFPEAGAMARVADVAVTRLGGNPSLRSRLYVAWGRSLRQEGRLSEAARAFELAASIDADTHGADHPLVALGLTELADAQLELGQPQAAHESITRALGCARIRAGGPTWAACLVVAARCELARGVERIAAARSLAEEADRIFARFAERRADQAEARTEVAIAALAAGQPEAATRSAEEALGLFARGAFDPVAAALARLVLARSLARVDASLRGDPGRAAALEAEARAACDALGSAGDARFRFLAARASGPAPVALG